VGRVVPVVPVFQGLPASIRRRAHAALARSGLRTFGELQHRVLTDSAFFTGVLEDLTVRVSEMFRDPDFYRAFRSRVVPILHTYPLLKIWHTGCAT
jgi:chemotaxis protein methyltransferase CheR